MDYQNIKFRYYYQRDVNMKYQRCQLQKKTNIMNDDSVSECEMGLTKEN